MDLDDVEHGKTCKKVAPMYNVTLTSSVVPVSSNFQGLGRHDIAKIRAVF